MHAELADMLIEAATLMLVGMSMVFIFLSALIGAVNLIAWACAGSFDGQDKINTSHPSRQSSGQSSTQNISPATVAAISAAIHQHRNAKSQR